MNSNKILFLLFLFCNSLFASQKTIVLNIQNPIIIKYGTTEGYRAFINADFFETIKVDREYDSFITTKWHLIIHNSPTRQIACLGFNNKGALLPKSISSKRIQQEDTSKLMTLALVSSICK